MDDFSALIEAFRIGGTPLALVAAFVMWLRTSASAPGAIKKSLEDRIDAHEKRLTEKIEKQGAELRGSIANQSFDMGSKIGQLSERVSLLEGRVKGWLDARGAPISGGANGDDEGDAP